MSLIRSEYVLEFKNFKKAIKYISKNILKNYDKQYFIYSKHNSLKMSKKEVKQWLKDETKLAYDLKNEQKRISDDTGVIPEVGGATHYLLTHGVIVDSESFSYDVHSTKEIEESVML
jgi:hypothetical protein